MTIRDIAKEVKKVQARFASELCQAYSLLNLDRRDKDAIALRHRQLVRYFPHDPLRKH